MNAHAQKPHVLALVRALRENGRLLATLAGRCEAVGLAPPTRGATFRQPADIVAYLGPEMAQLPQEQLRVVLLDRRNRLIDAPLIYQGGQTETAVRLTMGRCVVPTWLQQIGVPGLRCPEGALTPCRV